MKSILQILKINDPRSGTSIGFDGKPRAWESQDAECLLLTEEGVVDQVGVLRLPNDLRGTITPGIYMGSFALRPDVKTRKIGAVLVGLTPYSIKPAAKAA